MSESEPTERDEMYWSEMVGERLRGVMPEDGDVWLFFEDEAARLTSHNKDYSWYDNWDVVEVRPESEWPDRDDEYKVVGETVLEVWTDGYDTETTKIEAHMEKWKDAVGDGSWGAKEGEQYRMAALITPTKVVEFGTVYWNCHYPSTVWDVIES